MAKRKPTTKKKTTARPTRRSGVAPSGADDSVRVRMYRQGLGDCFLLSFGAGTTRRHVLIDCGTLGSTTTGVKLAEVVDDIVSETGGKLDLLIATHEHHDHVSGFNSQRAKFDALEVARVWMAWTENPEDKLAKDVATTKRDLGTALAAALPALQAAPRDTPGAAAADAVSGMLGWFGDDTKLGAADFSTTVDTAMKYVRDRAGTRVRFLKPGALLEESWLPGFRVFVLGPPYSAAKLQNTGEKGSADLYSLANGLSAAASSWLGAHAPRPRAAVGVDPAEQLRVDQQIPFDPRFRRRLGDATTRARSISAYDAEDVKWRRIDTDWMNSASDLALQLDNITNNTSLALAFERISDGKVLLFPADAQEGSWLSWHDPSIQWELDGPSSGKQTVRASDLLERTVFYKVGHHGSHNATASTKGLELMKAKDLVAFIPVDRAVALTRNPKNSWRMPARALYRRLLEKCEGRVLRSDIGWAADSTKAEHKTTEKEFAGLATAAEWKRWGEEQAKAERNAKVAVVPRHAEFRLD